MLPALLALVLAQVSPNLYSQAVQSGTQYRNSYSSYLQSKNQFLQYRTASARLSSISDTNTVLGNRNLWQIAYLKYLRQTLADSTKIADYKQTVTYLDLETEINALSSMQNQFSTSDSFEKVNAISKTWESRLQNSDKLVSNARLQITSTRLTNLQNRLQLLLDQFQSEHASPSANMISTLNLIDSKLQTPKQPSLTEAAKLLLEIYAQP